MEKTIAINNRPIKLRASAIILILYKNYFFIDYGEDLKKIDALKSTNANIDIIQQLIIEINLKMLWCMAKAADKNFKCYEDFANEIKNIQLKTLLEIFEESSNLLNKSIGKNENKDKNKNDEEDFKAENLIACCNICNISLTDIKDMSIGFLLNTIREYANLHKASDDSRLNKGKNNKEKNNILKAENVNNGFRLIK